MGDKEMGACRDGAPRNQGGVWACLEFNQAHLQTLVGCTNNITLIFPVMLRRGYSGFPGEETECREGW